MTNARVRQAASALISIHDVMPQTMTRVQSILDDLHGRGIAHTTLLVVPGMDWSARDIEQLGRWQSNGAELAAHGWQHRAESINGIYHRLHSALISRDVAEHLALDETGIAGLMQKSHDWFVEHGLPAPRTYVPPAWALGSISSRALAATPFCIVETTAGFTLPKTGQRLRLPLLGFEADTRLRSGFLRVWNSAQLALARASRRALRISIHPYDPELRAAGQLRQILEQAWQPLRYADYLGTCQI